MKVLCVDTATRNNWVALYTDHKMTDCIGYEDRQSCLINLMPSIDALLKNAQIKLSDLDALITVVGPGAWSSLRIGIATVKQLCLVNRLPLATISSLDLIIEFALRQKIAGSRVLAVMNAQSGKVYSSLYDINNGSLSQISPYQWDTVEKTVQGIPDTMDELLIIGDGVDLFTHCLRPGWQIHPLILQHDSHYLATLGEIARARKPVYQHEEILLLKPLYIQPSSAEVEFKVSVT